MKDDFSTMHNLIIDMLAEEEGEEYSEYYGLIEASEQLLKNNAWDVISDTQTIVIEFPDQTYKFITMPFSQGHYKMVRIYNDLNGFVSLMDHRRNINNAVHEAFLWTTFTQLDAFSLEFVDRKSLTKQDYDVIKSNGFSFRGQFRWPKLRRMTPGYQEVFVKNFDELLDVSDTLMILNEVIECIVKDGYKPTDKLGEGIKVTISEHELALTTVNLSKYVNPKEPLVMRDELRLHRLKKLPRTSSAVEISGIFMVNEFPLGITEWGEELIGYPFMCNMADCETGAMFAPLVNATKEECEQEFLEWVSTIFFEHEFLPKKIIVLKEMSYMIANFCHALNIEIEIAKTLPCTIEFLEEMKDAFNQ